MIFDRYFRVSEIEGKTYPVHRWLDNTLTGQVVTILSCNLETNHCSPHCEPESEWVITTLLHPENEKEQQRLSVSSSREKDWMWVSLGGIMYWDEPFL